MTRTIDLPRADLMILQELLRDHLPPATSVWAFGSRVTGAARRYSDLDLALEGEKRLDPGMLARLSDALSESDLTIKVDLVDLRAVDPTFRQLAERMMLPLSLDTGT